MNSAFELPELVASDDDTVPDVTIEIGEIPERRGKGFELNAIDGDLYLAVPDIARFKISAGSKIIVDACPGVPDRNVRIYLLGSAFGALLHQRGMLPLHANAVQLDGHAVAFMGASGTGKSTLAAWFHQQGAGVIADDVCVVGFDKEGQPFASPGLRRLRLWAEALELMGGDPADYDRSYVGGAGQVDKFDVPIKSAGDTRWNVRLGALYLLERGERFSVTRLSGIEAAEAIIANTYRGSYLSAVNGQQDHWQSAIRLVRSVAVYRAVRLWDLAKLDDQCRRLRTHAMMATGPRTDASS